MHTLHTNTRSNTLGHQLYLLLIVFFIKDASLSVLHLQATSMYTCVIRFIQTHTTGEKIMCTLDLPNYTTHQTYTAVFRQYTHISTPILHIVLEKLHYGYTKYE